MDLGALHQRLELSPRLRTAMVLLRLARSSRFRRPRGTRTPAFFSLVPPFGSERIGNRIVENPLTCY